MTSVQRGPGAMADPSASPVTWGGRKAQEYVTLTLQTYGTVCWLCGLPGADSADHIIARDNGGAVYNLLNLGPAHRKCNYSRGKRDTTGPAALVEDGQTYFTNGA